MRVGGIVSLNFELERTEAIETTANILLQHMSRLKLILSSGWLFEFQHITYVGTDLSVFAQSE